MRVFIFDKFVEQKFRSLKKWLCLYLKLLYKCLTSVAVIDLIFRVTVYFIALFSNLPESMTT